MRTNFSKVLLTFLFLLTLSISWGVITDYSFSSSNSIYTEITDATTHGTSANDNEVFNAVPIGFDVNYNGTVYSSVSIATNGFIAMGSVVVSSNTAISTGTTNNVIVPLNRDLKSRSDGSLMSSLAGVAPNRVFTIQWHNYRRYPTAAANDTLNFQIKLFETSNVITFNYGHFYVVNVTTAATVQCGLRGAANTEFNNRMTTSDWTATTAGVANNSSCTINNTVIPLDGLIFSWSPAQAGSPPNSAQVVAPANGASNIALNSTLHWLSGGGAPTGYKIFLGTDNPPTNIANGILQTSTTYDPAVDFAFMTVYYWQIVPTNEFGDAIGCPVWSFTSMPDPTVTEFPYTQNWDEVSAPSLPPSWTVINANNDAFTWVTNTSSPNSAPNALRCSYNSANAIPMDDWIVSPPLQLTGGFAYKIQFYYKALSNTLPEKLEIKYGISNDVASLTNRIFLNGNITNTTYSIGEAYIPLTAGGIHYFGFHGFSNASMYYLFIDDVTVTEFVPVFNPPTNLTAVFGGNSITLSWQAPVGSVPTGYKIYRDGTPVNTSLVTATTYIDLTAPAGIHDYYVTAMYANPAGESTPTNTVSGEMLSPVYNLQYTVTQDNVSLTWTSPISREDSRPLTGYNVYRDWSVIATITDTAILNYTDSGMPNGSYIYEITAVYTTGESAPCPSVIVTVYVPNIPIIYQTSFEEFPDFALNFGNWLLLDVDTSPTLEIDNIDFANEGSPMAFMIFNPSATTPPITDTPAHTGQKMAACIAATTPPNNDWMITPRLQLGTENSVSLWVRSANNENGLERFRVGLSTNINASPETFTMLSGPNYVEAPLEWTLYTYQVPTSFNTRFVRFGIKCESNNAFALLVDDVKIKGYNGVGNDEEFVPITKTALLGNYPNPFNAETSISYNIKNDTPVNIEIYNLKGQKVKTLVNSLVKAGNHKITWKGTDDNGRKVTSGIYVYRMYAGSHASSQKMILMK
jgi:hypothetical protein